MAFNWGKYLELAQYLHDNAKNFPDEEACFRASVSRAYYAAFCKVRTYIKDTEDEAFNGGDAHFKIRKHLKDSGDRLKRKIANQLEMIHKNRKKADYDDSLRERPSFLSGKTVGKAKEIISEVKTLYHQ